LPTLLDRINSPSDLKSLTEKELILLADELREKIIASVSRTGGHLASSLGVVELTIALHYVFDTPKDSLIWDVGHQSYAHKILTGRRDNFHTLRRNGGISGFPRREESPYDTFDTGHSGTSISVAAGIAEAKCLKKADHKAIAVIGDGSMTAGMALEGLNQAGHLRKDLIIILNDNEMSISPNVGALANYFSRIMTGQFITRFKNQMKSFLKTIPGIGESIYHIAKQAEEYFKGFLAPGIFFEELGFKYVGPIQGHQLNHLIETLKNVKRLPGPILVHVVTTKGKGYPPAEKDPTLFHGVEPFDIQTGKIIAKKETPTYTQIFSDTIIKLASENKKIIAITAAMLQGTGLDKFSQKFPDRFYDVGIAEQHGITFAAGLALEGFIPVVAIYSTFLQRAYDQIVLDICLQKLPVVLAIDRGGIVGSDGPTHQGVFDFSYLRHIPNIVVMAPKDENELRHMLKTAVECRSPVSIRYPRGEGYNVKLDSDLKLLDIGKGETITPGKDVVIFAIGSTVYPAIDAAKNLRKEGIEATVVNSRFVKPLDSELICSLADKIGNIVTVEENVLPGGFGSAILELLEENNLIGVNFKRVGIPDEFIEHGLQESLRRKYGLNSKGITQAVLKLLK
jgi:1-deoxy-D-xylulose-5-phosphate synthase